MAVNTFKFTTGAATLGDDAGQPGLVVGTLSYNGCVFSPLFTTNVSGKAAPDAANRTIKYVDYDIVVDGYVTAPDPAVLEGIIPTMATLYNLLEAQGGALVYKDRAHDLVVNPAGGGGTRDQAWGPVPEVLEFQPLGGGLSAKIRWQVKVRVPEVKAQINKIAGVPLLQFNYDTSLKFGEDGYSSLDLKGVVEIGLTRPTQATRTLNSTVDDVRNVIEGRLMSGIDLTRFKFTDRNFNVSRDKRLLEWSWSLEEKPYVDLPPDCIMAHGSYSVRPAKTGMGLVMWLCTLRATYTVPWGRPRRVAWFAFLAMLREKMRYSVFGNTKSNNPFGPAPFVPQWPATNWAGDTVNFWRQFLQSQRRLVNDRDVTQKAWLIDFSFDEGMYQDSKTTSFSATFRTVTTFDRILIASGLWKKLPEEDARRNNLWASSIRGISGTQSWLLNPLDPALDVIVDFGGG